MLEMFIKRIYVHILVIKSIKERDKIKPSQFLVSKIIFM